MVTESSSHHSPPLTVATRALSCSCFPIRAAVFQAPLLMSVTRLQNEASQSIRDRVQSIIHYLRSEIRLLVIPPVTGEIPKCERVRLVRSSRSAVHPFAPELQKPRRSEQHGNSFTACPYKSRVRIANAPKRQQKSRLTKSQRNFASRSIRSFVPFVRYVNEQLTP